MKKITIGEKTIKLTVGDQLTVRELRKIYPLISKYWDNEIEMVVQVIMALSDDKNVEDTINSMTQEEFTELSEEISKLLDTKKK